MQIKRKSVVAVATFVLLSALSACSLNTEDYPLGNLSVRVLDQNNAGVQAVAVDLYKYVSGGALHWRAGLTNSDGVVVLGESDGGVIEGEYFVRIRLITNHSLAPGETNDRPVAIEEGDDVVMTFRVVTSGPSGA